ncbi:integral membrane protein 2C-like [Gymnodraco acuticeps]|uniref:Integral membrane protein 2 n=1 Tax=Gymnodraco acuticeps TaxID=8218 RepID=A0A6P8VNT3_GYMAC|nr:integral membrane protein 2C-like [Gymnodraco acuticeps]
MGKISFQPVAGQKLDKEDHDGDKTEILIPHPMDDDDLVLPLRPRKSALNSVCCMTFGLVMFMAGLVLASIYVYRYYFIPHNPQLGYYSELCRVIYDVDDPEYGELRRLLELEENVDIYLDENYEKISVPVPHFGGSDPADIIHDFHRGLTAYHDIALDKCYVIELNTTIVMPPRNFWELLNNVKKGTYLPQTYIIHEEMVVTGKVHDMRQLGPFIYRLCSGKETYRLSRSLTRRRINKRDAKDCHHIRHFENTFVVETVICDEA